MAAIFRLRFRKNRIRSIADRYSYGDAIPTDAGRRAEKVGFYTKEDFLATVRWKSPRAIGKAESNSAKFIEEVTRIALRTGDEHLKIAVLTLLSGVSWPTASVFLHFSSNFHYPILDFRALWSLRNDSPPSKYTFPFWEEYTAFLRKLSLEEKVDMRTLDRALWQYSKEHQ